MTLMHTINCSSSELSNRNLFDELMAIINSNNIMPEHIRLELTESAMFDDFNMVIHNMEKLNESGIKFYLDDFGTGYSNLERIIGCPFNTIKFDKHCFTNLLISPLYRILYLTLQAYSRNRDLYY